MRNKTLVTKKSEAIRIECVSDAVKKRQRQSVVDIQMHKLPCVTQMGSLSQVL